MSTENQDNGEEQKKPEGQEGQEGNATPEGGMPDANETSSSTPDIEPINVPEQPETPTPEPVAAPEPVSAPEPAPGPDLSKPEETAAPAPSNGPDLNKPQEPAAPAPQQPDYGQQQPNYGQQQQQQNYGQQPQQQQYQQQGQQNYNQYGGPPQGMPQVPNGTAVLVLGIISIALCWCYGIVGLIAGIVALAISGNANRAIAENPTAYQPQSISNFKTGKILAIIGMSLSALVLIYVVVVFLFLASAASAPMYYNGF